MTTKIVFSYCWINIKRFWRTKETYLCFVKMPITCITIKFYQIILRKQSDMVMKLFHIDHFSCEQIDQKNTNQKSECL